MTHYIATAGLRGYLPNYCECYETEADAVQALADLHDLGRDRTRRLKRDLWLDLNIHRDGNEYAQVEPCECDTPEDHSESGEWPE